MKNFAVGFVLIMLPFSIYSQYRFGLAFGGNNEGLRGAYGNHLRVYYNFQENFKLNSEFTRYYQVEDNDQLESFSYDLRSLDISVNYGVLFGEKLCLYGILGIDYSFGREVVKNVDGTQEEFIESLGLNGGFGASYRIARFTPYIELRNIASSSYYLIYSVGLSYSFGKRNDDL